MQIRKRATRVVRAAPVTRGLAPAFPTLSSQSSSPSHARVYASPAAALEPRRLETGASDSETHPRSSTEKTPVSTRSSHLSLTTHSGSASSLFLSRAVSSLPTPGEHEVSPCIISDILNKSRIIVILIGTRRDYSPSLQLLFIIY